VKAYTGIPSDGRRIHCRLEPVEAVELGVMVRLVDRNYDDEGSSLRVGLFGCFQRGT
jgi:hypothetical protein